MDLADNTYSIAASLPRLFGALPLVHRVSGQQTTAVTPGACFSPDWSEDMRRNVYDMYQPVQRVKGNTQKCSHSILGKVLPGMVLERVIKVPFVSLAVDRPRPVIILGIQESQVVEILLDDPMFEKCPVGTLT